MKKYILVIIFIFIHFVSCQQSEIDPKEYFQQVVNIKANQLGADTYKLSSFGRMILFESKKCLIKENYLGESLLDKTYYTKDSILSFTQTGEGPDENIMPRSVQKKDESDVIVLDIRKKQVVTKSLSKSISSIVSLGYMFLSAIQTKHGYVVSGLLDREETNARKYALFDCAGKYVKSFGDSPNDGNNSRGKSKTFAYRDYIVHNPVLDRLTTVVASGAISELYQIGTTPMLIKRYHDIYPIYIDDSRSDRNGVKHGKENVISYTDVYTTDYYIYTLYSGKRLDQHANVGVLDTMLNDDILVYDQGGECIRRLVTNIRLFNVCVANDDKELIALGWDDSYHLHFFDLPEVTFTW